MIQKHQTKLQINKNHKYLNLLIQYGGYVGKTVTVIKTLGEKTELLPLARPIESSVSKEQTPFKKLLRSTMVVAIAGTALIMGGCGLDVYPSQVYTNYGYSIPNYEFVQPPPIIYGRPFCNYEPHFDFDRDFDRR